MEHTKRILKKAIAFFNSYGFLGFKAFIKQDDGNINKILYYTKNFIKKDNIVAIVAVTFSKEKYEKLSQNEISRLSSMAADLFHLINKFAELNKIKHEIILHFIDDQQQNET